MDLAGELSLSLSAFCILANWDLSAANSIAVGGRAGAVAAAAIDEGVSGRAEGSRDDMGRSVIERSNWRRYLFTLVYD